jgi:hypothetical protein
MKLKKSSPWPLGRFVTVYKNIGNKVVFFWKVYYNASFNDTKINGASVGPVSRIVSSAMLLLLIVGEGTVTLSLETIKFVRSFIKTRKILQILEVGKSRTSIA